MKKVTFHFDPISPYAYLAFEHLPVVLQGLSYKIIYQPVLFAGLLKHHGQLGPAEIPSKREWTYRHVQWLALELGIDMQLPVAHPFNPLDLLRLAVACNTEGLPNRYVTEKLFHHVWRGGLDAQDSQRLLDLKNELKPKLDPNSEGVKTLLRTHTQNAINKGVFGVPTLEVDEKLFFGLDSLPMLAAYLKQDNVFSFANWDNISEVKVGVARK